MNIIEPSYKILTDIPNGDDVLKQIEIVARTCYKSEANIKKGSAEKLIGGLIKSGHEAMIEFGPSITVKFICDRGVSHEFVRHRLCSFAQESQRYVNYSLEKNGDGDISFIRPLEFNDIDEKHKFTIWKDAMQIAENMYLDLIDIGTRPEVARSVLPNSVKTEINIKANLREWRHLLKLRTAKDAHPEIRRLCVPLLKEFKSLIPVVFDDILEDE